MICGSNWEELTVEFEELGSIWDDINIIYFDEADIVKYLTTDEYFMLKFTINGRTYEINSDLYFLLEQQLKKIKKKLSFLFLFTETVQRMQKALKYGSATISLKLIPLLQKTY